jgi:hypothetical protein
VGTMGEAISLRVRNRRGSDAPKVVKQIETSRLPDPIMRRPRADREEKQVTYGNGGRRGKRSSLTPTPQSERNS